MSRFHHPVAGADLLRSPEMQLRHPRERHDTESERCNDEGTGCGFDQISPDAYAERWVDITEGATHVMQWFVAEFTKLGWHPQGPIPTSGVAHLSFRRDDPDERLGVLVQGHGEWWKDSERLVKWDTGINSLRVHLAVDGVFPDGSQGPRVG